MPGCCWMGQEVCCLVCWMGGCADYCPGVERAREAVEQVIYGASHRGKGGSHRGREKGSQGWRGEGVEHQEAERQEEEPQEEALQGALHLGEERQAVKILNQPNLY